MLRLNIGSLSYFTEIYTIDCLGEYDVIKGLYFIRSRSRIDWLTLYHCTILTDKTGNQNVKYDRDYKPLIVKYYSLQS